MKNATNAKLESAEVITGFGTNTLYLKLIYTYEDELGKHRLTFPAVNTTIPKNHEPAPKEMTLDEIEKKLGYKVKIINKE